MRFLNRLLLPAIIFFQFQLLSGIANASYCVQINYHNKGAFVAQFWVDYAKRCDIPVGQSCVMVTDSSHPLVASTFWFAILIGGYNCFPVQLNSPDTIPEKAATVKVNGKTCLKLTVNISGDNDKSKLDYEGGPATTGKEKSTLYSGCTPRLRFL